MKKDTVENIIDILTKHQYNYKKLYDKSKNPLFLNKWEALFIVQQEINTLND